MENVHHLYYCFTYYYNWCLNEKNQVSSGRCGTELLLPSAAGIPHWTCAQAEEGGGMVQ